MKAIERLYQYLETKGIKPTNFEKEMGLSNGYLSIQKKRKADIGESVLKKITEYCRDLNPTWLLTGEGDMLLDFTKGITGGEDSATDEEFNIISKNIALLNNLLLPNKRTNQINSSYDDINGKFDLLHAYLDQYDLLNKMSDVLECYQQKQVGMEDVVEEFKSNFSVVEELYSIVEPYKATINELLDKVSDFNDKHDRLYLTEE